MKNFISRIECVVEPNLYFNKEGESVQISIRCRIDDKEWGITKIEEKDFLCSHFDLIFDHMKNNIKYKYLEEVSNE